MVVSDVWAQVAAGGIVSAFGACGAAIKALWSKVATIEARCAKERDELTARWIAEVRARVRDFNAPAPTRPEAPLAPTPEDTGVHELRDLITEAELEAYTRSTR
jgi:hypothetical protein